MKKITSFIISVTVIFLFCIPSYSADRGNTTNQSFSKAKKLLERQVYPDQGAPTILAKTMIKAKKLLNFNQSLF